MGRILTLEKGSLNRRYEAPFADIKSFPFYVKGDGITDDTDAIQAVLDYLNTISGGILYFPTGTYLISDTLIVYSNITLTGAGRGAAVIDGTGLESTLLNPKTFINISGSLGSSLSLSENALEGAASVTLASTSGLSADDWVLIGSAGTLPDGLTGYLANVGEIKRIRTIADGVVTFEDNLFYSYNTSDSAFVKEITFKKNITVSNLTIRGTDSPNGETGLLLRYAKNVIVENVNFEYVDVNQLQIDSSIYVNVMKNHFWGTYYDGITGNNFYAVVVQNCSQWINVIGNTSVECRHLFVCTANSSGQGLYGQPLFVNVEGNIANHCNASYAYENHGFGRYINIIGNTANKCYNGVHVCGGYMNIEGNMLYDCSNIGIGLDTGLNIRDINIKGNQLIRCSGYSISLSGTATYLINGVTIEGNRIVEYSTSYAIYINQYASNVNVIGNSVKGNGGATGYGICNLSANAIISNNRIGNKAGGVYNTGNNSIITDNHFNVTTQVSGIYNQSDDTTITGNHFTSMNWYCIYNHNDSDYCIIKDNVTRGNTNTIRYGSGTGTMTDGIAYESAWTSCIATETALFTHGLGAVPKRVEFMWAESDEGVTVYNDASTWMADSIYIELIPAQTKYYKVRAFME